MGRKNEVLREYYRVLFGVVIEKNPDCIWRIRRRTDMDRTAADIFVEVYKDKVDEITDERADERARETKIMDAGKPVCGAMRIKLILSNG